MVRTILKCEYPDGVGLYEVFCVSTDDKPTKGMATGSFAHEVDTTDVYSYDEESETWTKQLSFSED